MADHRGGLTAKVHLAADNRCRPLVFVLTAGQAGDAPAFPVGIARLHLPHLRCLPLYLASIFIWSAR